MSREAGLRSARHALPWLLPIAVGAWWATRAGTLPGQHLPFGPLVEALGWSCLYGLLCLSYRFPERPAGDSPRVLRTIGLCLLLALLSTQLCRVLATTLVAPQTWSNLFYLKLLVPLGALAFWCACQLPADTRALVRALWSRPGLAPLPQLVLLLAAAIVLVSVADLAFEVRGRSAVEVALKSELITKGAWAANILILFSAYALVLAVTSRLSAALLLVSPAYILLGVASLAKIRYMHTALQPLDLVRIREFLPLFRSYFGIGGVAAVVTALALWVVAMAAMARTRPMTLPPLRRWAIGVVALTGLLAYPAGYLLAERLPSVDGLLVRLGGRGREYREFREMARANGFLMVFLSDLPAAFVAEPQAYSTAGVEQAQSKYCAPSGVGPARRRGVNLIVYMVESFMDPNDLGLHFTSDPIPNFRALHQSHIGGYGIVPEDFGGSANSEFEVLTGMTTSFLPEGGVAYRLYLRNSVPSLPGALHRLGYVATAVQADPKYFYGRETVYPLLGFDRVVWLREDPDAERAPRGWWPSDEAVVQAVIQASQAPDPFFIFAFPSSTHSPYDGATYERSPLSVIDPPSPEGGKEVKEYINTLRDADQALGTLIEYFRGRPDSTIIAVLGDHLPPLSEYGLESFLGRLSALPETEQARMRRRVPLLVWANFPLPREQVELSLNALPSYLLEKMGVAPQGFLAVSNAVRHRVPVLGRYAQGADGRIWSRDSLPQGERQVVDDYRLLQYDLLLGKRYGLGAGGAAQPDCGLAAHSPEGTAP